MKGEETAGSDIRKRFAEAGFEIAEISTASGSMSVRKYNCARDLERKADGSWSFLGPPHFIVRGLNCELEDGGYQKFWLHAGMRFPIRKRDLEALHRFDEEVREVLGLRSLYNESLGSTCARTVYDRLDGRASR